MADTWPRHENRGPTDAGWAPAASAHPRRTPPGPPESPQVGWPLPGYRSRAQIEHLHQDARVRLTNGAVLLGALHAVEGNALRAVVAETTTQLGGRGDAPLSIDQSSTLFGLRHELQLAEEAARGMHRIGVVGAAYSLATQAWGRNESDARPVSERFAPPLADTRIGVREAGEVTALAEDYAVMGREQAGAIDPWNRGIGVVLHWAAGALGVPPMLAIEHVKTAPAIGGPPPRPDRLADEAQAADQCKGYLRHKDTDVIGYVYGAWAALAWLIGETEQPPVPR